MNRPTGGRSALMIVALLVAQVVFVAPAAAADPTPTPHPTAGPTPPKGGTPAVPETADLFPPPGQPPTAKVPVSYSSDDFKYKSVPRPDPATDGFEAIGFPETGFSTGGAPFGTTFTGSSCPTGALIRNPWPINTDLLLRKWVDLPTGGANLVVAVAIDNDVRVYWNGTEITPGAAVGHEGCAVEDSFVFKVPDNLVTSGQNLLAVRAVDRGSESFVDVEVRVQALGAPPDERFGRCGPTPEQNLPSACRNEPVNTLTGAYASTVRDLALPGRGLAFALDRTYNSLDTGASELGPGWRHSYSTSLVFRPDGSALVKNN